VYPWPDLIIRQEIYKLFQPALHDIPWLTAVSKDISGLGNRLKTSPRDSLNSFLFSTCSKKPHCAMLSGQTPAALAGSSKDSMAGGSSDIFSKDSRFLANFTVHKVLNANWLIFYYTDFFLSAMFQIKKQLFVILT